ncbi:MAG: LON peptidase substrate-binding domain-containing protein [Bacillota bacterium]
MLDKIPIFPLNIVIYPDSSYELHIFEDRYRKMINECISGNHGFGIVSKIGQEISKIGSFVEITKIKKRYKDGKIDIVVKGTKRFNTVASYLTSEGYIEAVIEPYLDSSYDNNNLLYSEIFEKFVQILDKINFELEPSFWTKLNSTSFKSFKLAEKSGLTLEEQQQLLSIKSETKRLYFLKCHFDKIEKYIEETLVIKDIIMGDGYLN